MKNNKNKMGSGASPRVAVIRFILIAPLSAFLYFNIDKLPLWALIIVGMALVYLSFLGFRSRFRNYRTDKEWKELNSVLPPE